MGAIEPRVVRTKSGDEIQVRCARIGDANAILELARAVQQEGAFNVTVPEGFHLSVADEQTWIEDHQKDPGLLLLIAESDNRLAGLVHVEARKQERLAHSGSLAIAVSVEARGRGVGRALMETLLQWAETSPLERVELAVLGNNERAIALYKGLGFVEEGRRQRGVKLGPDVYADDVLMCRFV